VLLVAHPGQNLDDGGIEGGAHWRWRDRDAPALRRLIAFDGVVLNSAIEIVGV
jgi:hypothetical protein